MATNPWLITWEIVNPNNPIPKNLIAAMLHSQTSEGDVKRLMTFLYHTEGGYLSEQLRFAKRDYIEKPFRVDRFPRFQLGSSPFLYARHVRDFKVERTEDWDEIATWTERKLILPNDFAENLRATISKQKTIKCRYK